jgi:hypothetical protein
MSVSRPSPPGADLAVSMASGLLVDQANAGNHHAAAQACTAKPQKRDVKMTDM